MINFSALRNNYILSSFLAFPGEKEKKNKTKHKVFRSHIVIREQSDCHNLYCYRERG